MIAKESRSIEWITQVAKENNAKDIGLVEKTIRAFSLLESLARSGCPFIFKGGSCLMLHFNTSRRLSIDIDIVCPPGTDIEAYIGYLAEEYGFGEVKLVDRLSRDNVPKSHAKYYYEVAYGSQSRPDHTTAIHVSVEVFLDAAVPHKSAEGRYNHCKTASPDYG